MTEQTRKRTWVEEHLPPDYLELAKTRHLPMPGRVGYGERPAILVIDMARAWTDPESPMGADMTDTIAHIKSLLDVARRTEPKIPIFFSLEGVYDPSLKGITEVHNRKRPHLAKQLVAGSPWLEIDHRLERQPDELIFTKEHGTCLSDSVLLRMLISNKCDTLIITGCSISFCVMATAYDAAQLGFHGIIPAEAVADRDPIMGWYMLLNLDWKVVDVEPVAEVIEYLKRFLKK
ncbi:MAG: isochorismatase family protein [Dehalococcoidales bacterium]|nr:isochorismatase family protein [Dehalococcoidales bacterium]